MQSKILLLALPALALAQSSSLIPLAITTTASTAAPTGFQVYSVQNHESSSGGQGVALADIWNLNLGSGQDAPANYDGNPCDKFTGASDFTLNGLNLNSSQSDLPSMWHSDAGVCGTKDLDFWLDSSNPNDGPVYNVFVSGTYDIVATCSAFPNPGYNGLACGSAGPNGETYTFAEQWSCGGTLCASEYSS